MKILVEDEVLRDVIQQTINKRIVAGEYIRALKRIAVRMDDIEDWVGKGWKCALDMYETSDNSIKEWIRRGWLEEGSNGYEVKMVFDIEEEESDFQMELNDAFQNWKEGKDCHIPISDYEICSI